jgi:NAD(P)H-dependent FMN reductase
MSSVLALSGSLRSGSYNTSLLRAAKQLFPTAISVASIADIPLYNADVEAAGFPATVETLKQRIAAADGLLIASPEYNNSVPGVLKNAMDWLSRPSGDIRNVFRDRPVAVIGVSPGGFGTISAQAAWLPVWRALGARHWSGGRLLVSHARQVFDSDGALVDDDIRQRLETYVRGFIDFCDKCKT